MAGFDKRELPSLARLSIAVLGLSSGARTLLTDTGFYSVGELFYPTEAQREALAHTGSQIELREINGKLRHFCRSYLAVKGIMEGAAEDTTAPQMALSSPSGAGLPPKQSTPRPTKETSFVSVAEMPLTDLQLPSDTVQVLGSAGVETVPQLMQWSDTELASIDTLGEENVASIRRAVDEYLVRTLSTGSTSDAEQRLLELWPEATDALSGLREIPIAELIDRWIRRFLPQRERTAIEHHYGLYEPAGAVADLAEQYGVSEWWLRLLQENAVSVLCAAQEEISPLLQLVTTLLTASGGVLAASVMVSMLAGYGIKLGSIRLAGLLAFLADLNDDWEFLGGVADALVLAAFPHESHLAGRGGGRLGDWLQGLLGSEKCEIVERRYGLFKEQETFADIAKRLKRPELRVRQLERRAFHLLNEDREHLAPLFSALTEALNRGGGACYLEELIALPALKEVADEGILPTGILSLIADLRDDWRFYKLNDGVLVRLKRRRNAASSVPPESSATKREIAEIEAPVAPEVEQAESIAAAPGLTEEKTESKSDGSDSARLAPLEAAPEVRLDFVSTLSGVMDNVRQWNRDVETEAGRALWGQRTVTYFVCDPASHTFAPSKFCAYTAPPQDKPLSVATYAQIDPSLPIFDGQQAHRHLTRELSMELVALEPASGLWRRFQRWVEAHEDSIKVHPRGPKLLLPPESGVTSAVTTATDSADDIPPPATTDAAVVKSDRPAKLASRRRKIRETGPSWSQPKQRRLKFPLDQNSPFSPIEMELRERLHHVDFIGELAVERGQFEEWCGLVRKEAIRGGRTRPKLIPPALFVTLMVFAARYSEEKHRTFWEPYAEMVWGLEELSQYFPIRCRNYFSEAVTFLTGTYGLTFPQRSVGDLVRPVYRHAIIPAYLEPIFVSWLKSHWEEVLEVPPAYLVAHLQQERSLRNLPRTLRRFIEQPDTAVAAADLIRNMAFAASLYEEGKNVAFIAELLADSPIERSLWEEFSVIFAGREEQARRRARARLEWVWSLETTEMMLRLRNVVLSTDTTPDLAVWVAVDTPEERLPFADFYMRLEPWQLDEDEWLIDELLFAPEGPLNGRIVLLGSDDSILWEQVVPPLPTEPVQFFRISQQRVYALAVDGNAVQEGRYVIACREGVTLDGDKAETVLNQEPVTLPHLIQGDYAVAGTYEVSLPLNVTYEQQTVLKLARSGSGMTTEPARIVGEGQVPDLSPRVPPAFNSRDVWLVIPGATERLLERTSVWLRSQRGSFRRYMLRDVDIELDEAGAFWVPLGSLLEEDGGYYTVELRQGLRALLPAPLELVHLPGLDFVPPAKQPEGVPVYTPVHLPTARIKGLRPDQIGNLTQVEAVPTEDGWLGLTWHDVRGDCRLLLRVNQQSIPLAWPVQRFSAWIEPAPYDGVFAPEDLDKANLRASGSRDVTSFFFVGITGDAHKLQVQLNAQGQFSASLRTHGLMDIIRHQPGGRVQVDASIFDQSWPLLVVQRYLELSEAKIAYDESKRTLRLKTGLQGDVAGTYTFLACPVDKAVETKHQLAEVKALEPQHIIACQLPQGRYRFEVRDGENVLTPPTLTFFTGKLSGIVPVQVTPVPVQTSSAAFEKARSELTALITKVDEGEIELTPDYLWRLATVPGPALEDFENARLRRLWAPLADLQTVHDVHGWEARHGLLPAWVVTSRPLRLAFNRGATIVYPEVALERGNSGIGYANLNFIHGLARVYATWEPSSKGGQVVRVRFGVPPNIPLESYQNIDDLDLEAVYQCMTCGCFLSQSQHRTGRHAHAGENSLTLVEAHNWTDDNPFLAQVTPGSPDFKLRHLHTPNEVIDRGFIARGLRDRRYYYYGTVSEVTNVTTAAAHRAVCAAWLKRYWNESSEQWHLKRMLSGRSWQRTATKLEKRLASSTAGAPAAFAALGRLLGAFNRRSRQSVSNLDRDLLLLSLLVRHAGYDPAGAAQVRRQVGSDEALLSRLLYDAQDYTPELLQWALTWAELFFVHSLT